MDIVKGQSEVRIRTLCAVLTIVRFHINWLWSLGVSWARLSDCGSAGTADVGVMEMV